MVWLLTWLCMEKKSHPSFLGQMTTCAPLLLSTSFHSPSWATALWDAHCKCMAREVIPGPGILLQLQVFERAAQNRSALSAGQSQALMCKLQILSALFVSLQSPGKNIEQKWAEYNKKKPTVSGELLSPHLQHLQPCSPRSPAAQQPGKALVGGV